MGALASRSLTPLLHRLVAANRALDAREAARSLMEEPCICGVAMRFHRLPSNAQVSCAEALDRCFIGEDVPQADQRVEPAARGTQVGGGDGHRAQRGLDLGVEVVGHDEQVMARPYSGPREIAGEGSREATAPAVCV